MRKFNPSLHPDESAYDPLSASEDQTEGRTTDQLQEQAVATHGQRTQPVRHTQRTQSQPAPHVPTETPNIPAPERINHLFHSMKPQRRVLLRIIAFCKEPRLVSDVNEKIANLQVHDESVYSPADLCNLLEEAGAIERISPDGEDARNLKQKPEIVTVDGVDYIQPAQQKQSFWRATPAGLLAVQKDNPDDRIEKLLRDDKKYAEIYKKILVMCNDKPQTVKALNNAVNGLDLLQNPRLYAPHFIDRLEKCEALLWNGAWEITSVGKKALQLIANQEN